LPENTRSISPRLYYRYHAEQVIFTSELRQKTLNSLWWSAADNFGVQLLLFLINVIMARQVPPEGYGLIAMLSIFMAIAQSFVDSGFSSALIQKQDAGEVHYSSIFYFNIVMGLVMAGLLCWASPYIASFYGQAILTPLACFMSLNLIIGSLGSVPNSLMKKNLDFRSQTIASLLSAVFSGIIGIALALYGWGVWSIAAQNVALTLFRTVFLWILGTWRPTRSFSMSVLGEMFGFGSRLLAAGLIDVIFTNLYQLVIGKIFSARDLGFYTQASRIKQLPAGGLSAIVSRVSFPVLALIQNDPVQCRHALRKAVGFLGMVNFPLTIGLAVCAQPVVMVLLTNRWASVIPYLQILCAVALFYPLQVINLNVVTALGRSDLFFRLEIWKKLLTVANIIIAYRWGVLGIVYGQVIVAFLSYLINSSSSAELVGYSTWDQARDLSPYLLVSIIMGFLVMLISYMVNLDYLLLLTVQIVSGAVIYIGLCRILRLEVFMETQMVLLEAAGALGVNLKKKWIR